MRACIVLGKTTAIEQGLIYIFTAILVHIRIIIPFIFQGLLITETILKGDPGHKNDADIVHYISLFFPTYS